MYYRKFIIKRNMTNTSRATNTKTELHTGVRPVRGWGRSTVDWSTVKRTEGGWGKGKDYWKATARGPGGGWGRGAGGWEKAKEGEWNKTHHGAGGWGKAKGHGWKATAGRGKGWANAKKEKQEEREIIDLVKAEEEEEVVELAKKVVRVGEKIEKDPYPTLVEHW